MKGLRMRDDEVTLAVKAAQLYFEDRKTQEEIGSLLQITRWKVGRLLNEAREKGIIKIEIVHPTARRVPLERQLKEVFGLVDSIVVPADADEPNSALRLRAAAAAAEYLTALRPQPRTLGVSWGRTMGEVAAHLRQGWAVGTNVVLINGGLSSRGHGASALETAALIARKGRGRASILPTPAILDRVETKRAIESDRFVARILEIARDADAYVFSAGLVELSSVFVESGFISPQKCSELLRAGAAGEVVGRFIDANGAIVDHELDECTVGIHLEELRSAERAIAVIAGTNKREVCRAVVSGGLCSVLVTDEWTARYLLSVVDDEDLSSRHATTACAS
jgi:deoxyribonucleoside regulator